MTILRMLAAFFAAAAAFVAVFLAIFVSMLIHDMHVAPHDGQGGLAGFMVGGPVAAIAALIAGVSYYSLAKRRGWFSN